MSDFEDAMDALFEHEDQPTIREDYVKAPFSWPGGKSKSVKTIVPLIPIRGKYVEVCGGAGSVLLARDRSKLEVFNDRHSGVTDFYKTLASDKRDALIEQIDLLSTIHSRELFGYCKESWTNTLDPIERGAKWYYMVCCSFGSQNRNFGRATSGTNIIAEKLQKKLPRLMEVSKRLRGVLIENQDLFQILNDFDHHDTVFYIDPPYVSYSKGMYEYEMKKSDHIKLVNRIMELKGFVALSGYSNPIYDSFDWTERHEWDVYVTAGALAFTDENHMKGKENSVGRRSQKEVLWIKESL